MRLPQLLLVILLSLATASSSWANKGLDEYTLKAALMVKLLRFIYLPPNKLNLTSLNLCVIGNNPFGNSLDKLTAKPIDGIQIHIKNLNRYNKEVCDFSFITETSAPALSTLLTDLKQHKSVTISDIPNFTKRGGMLELALSKADADKIEVLIHLENAQEQDIKFSAQLLRLARLVN